MNRQSSSTLAAETRRSFIRSCGLAVAGLMVPSAVARVSTASFVMTVRGPIAPKKLGVTLTHEHVLVDFIGAEQGCWVSFDGFGTQEMARYIEVFKTFGNGRRLGQLLLSHDAGWFRPGEPGGGEFRPYEDLFRVLVPQLRKAGVSAAEIQKVMVTNPAQALTVRVRPL